MRTLMPCFFALAGVAQKKSATKREKRIDFMLIKVCVISTKIRRTFLSCSISSAITKKCEGIRKKVLVVKRWDMRWMKYVEKTKYFLEKCFLGKSTCSSEMNKQ